MRFYVLDVETANREASSICQIGIVEVTDLEITNRWGFYVDPEGPFEYHNVRVHGIQAEDVKDAQNFSKHYPMLKELLSNHHVVQHTNFDQMAIDQSTLKYNLELIPIKWVDSSKMARKYWPEYKDCGYGLKALSDIFGVSFKHHDACEDATATAKIVIATLKHHKIDIKNLYEQQMGESKTIRYDNKKISLTPNPDGQYFGKNICFTGIFSMSKKQAMIDASKLGFRIMDHVTFYTHFLVVGRPKRYGHGKSLEKAENLIEKKAPITILTEKEFVESILKQNS